jgi:hypothetical protein
LQVGILHPIDQGEIREKMDSTLLVLGIILAQNISKWTPTLFK